jgi:L-aminopeptidase/D-esterase-like protein
VSADLGAIGIAVGHATDQDGATGLTVIRGIESPLRAGAAIFGRATGTRELYALTSEHLVDRIDAVLLTGGSAYGLDAAAGVMRWMEERARGFAVPGGVVPIVPAAVIFDLAPLGRFDARPTVQMAYEACERAVAAPVAEGSVGVGTGATVGKIAGPAHAMKGGFGCAMETGARWRVAAFAVVNALGDVRDESGRIIAGARTDTADASRPFGGRQTPIAFVDTARILARGERQAMNRTAVPPTNTTLGVVATDAPLERTVLRQLARAAGSALFKRVTPTGTSVDGDIVFALAPAAAAPASTEAPMELEALAVFALESALERAVRTARGRDGIPGLAD